MYLREDNTPYYVGKGSGKRIYMKHNISVPKKKDRILIVYIDLDEESAFKLERYFISYYGRKDLETGILRNLTDGGEGCSGRVHTEDTKYKIGNVHRGKIVSESTRELQRLRKQGVYDGENNPMWGKRGELHPLYKKKRPEESVLKNSKSFIATYKDGTCYISKNLRKFCREHNLVSNNMSEVANGKRKQHKGWTCRYIEECDNG